MSILQNQPLPSLLPDGLIEAFPPQFTWGAATASYQVEGAVHEDGRGSSIWDDFAAMPGKVSQMDNGDVAADHYHRFVGDVELMAQLGLTAYRFSIAWPRILPEGRGSVNQHGLDFYERLVDLLLEKGIQPFATLYHWDLPSTLQQNGGWLNRDTANAFADYAELVVRRLGDRVASWTTLNEPWCSAYLGYGNGVHAPGIQDRQSALVAAHHLMLAHGLALPRIRTQITNGAPVGITLNLSQIYATDERPETLRDVALADEFANGWFLDPLFRGHYPEHLFDDLELLAPPIESEDLTIISTPFDFLGINNYTRQLIRGQEEKPLADRCAHVVPIPEACYTAMGWEIYPQGLRDLLIRLHQEYGVQNLYVTENGAAFNDVWDGSDLVHDPRRVEYLRQHIGAVAEAIQQGVPLRGYFVWSLLDNFEWAEGYSKRFGLIYVDYPTQRRILKESALWYTELLAAYEDLYNH